MDQDHLNKLYTPGHPNESPNEIEFNSEKMFENVD